MITKKEGVDDSWVLQYRYRDDPQWFLHGLTHSYENGRPLGTLLFLVGKRQGLINPLLNTKDYAFQLVNTITSEVIPWEALGDG